MIVVDDLNSEAIDLKLYTRLIRMQLWKQMDKNLDNLVKKHIAHKSLPKQEITKAFPWVQQLVMQRSYCWEYGIE